MSYATDKWFQYLDEEILIEGIRDIGLPEIIIDLFEDALDKTPEKGKTWAANQWKDTRMWNLGVNPWEGGANEKASEAFAQEFKEKLEFELEYAFPAGKKDEAVANREKIYNELEKMANSVEEHRFGSWNRTFKKSLGFLSDQGLPSRDVENVQLQCREVLRSAFERFKNQYQDVFLFLNYHRDNYVTVGKKNIDEAMRVAERFLAEQEVPDQIIMRLDDGYFWYDTEKDDCPIEAERMGHCGATSGEGSMMFSLRKHLPGRKESSSFASIGYSVDHDTVYQIKGRYNQPPDEDTWPHISAFLQANNVRRVQEQGQHSEDPPAFMEMINWLHNENPGIKFIGTVESRVDQMERELQEIEDDHADHEGRYILGFEVNSNVNDPENITFDAFVQIQVIVDLGWPNVNVLNGRWIPMDKRDENELHDINRIPTRQVDTGRQGGRWGLFNITPEQQEFIDEIGALEILDTLDHEVELHHATYWKVDMQGGQVRGDEDIPVGEEPKTAHLELWVGAVMPDNHSTEDFADFARDIQAEMDDNEFAYRGLIRTKLVENYYAIKTFYDDERKRLGTDELKERLDNWKITLDYGKVLLQFDPRDPPGRPAVVNVRDDTTKEQRLQIIPSNIKVPGDVFYYGTSHDIPKELGRLWPGLQKGSPHYNLTYAGDSLNRQMAQQLRAQAAMSQRGARQGQEELPLGPEYQWTAPGVAIAKDLRFVIVPQIMYFEGGGVQSVLLQYMLSIVVDSYDDEEQINTAVNFVEYLNDNPEQVFDAADEILSLPVEKAEDEAKRDRQDILDGSMAKTCLRAIGRRYSATASDNPLSKKAMSMAGWFQKNWDQMGAIERVVAINSYLYPMSQGASPLYNLNIEVEDQQNLGMPLGWNNLVAEEYRFRGRGTGGAWGAQYKWGPAKDAEINEPPALRGTVGEPQDAGSMRPAGDYRLPENINLEEELPPWIKTPEQCEEEQLERIGKLLEKKRDPKHDLRIYRIRVGCALVDRVGGTDAEIGAEIRGINAVTTVRPIAETKRDLTPTESYIVFEVKFELIGAQSRVEYRDKILLPQMRSISGLKIIDWTAVHQTNVQGTIRNVREGLARLNEQGFGSAFGMSNFGGLAGAMGATRDGYHPMPTPRPTLDSVLEDWVGGGVKLYDVPANTNNMQYHVMVPVKELWSLCSRMMRHPKDVFDIKQQRFDATYQRLKDKLKDPTAYHEFIKDGAQGPVYLALGKNGRMKITGNEDLVWFAKKSGLEEVPVFLSYQRQV